VSAGSIVLNQPGVYFVDADGNILSADNGTAISNHEGIIIAGSDGTNMRFMRVGTDGTLRIDPTGTTTQPISATSLPLPTGAATQATLATLATESKLEAVRALLATMDADTSNLDVALSTRASETKLEAVRLLLASLDAKDYATQTTLAAILVDTGQIETLLGTIDADTSALAAVDYATQTTLAAVLVDTGQIEALLTTIDADTSALAVVDYATATKQTDGSQKTQVVGNTGNIVGVNSSGQAAIQNPPNLNVAASTLATETKLEAVRAILATIDADTSALVAVDYATQTTLAALKAAFDSRDLATQTTLALADGRLTTIDAVLDSIKDTAGIKKITDGVQLQAGTNSIGTVKIESGNGSGDFANVDASKRLLVSTQAVAPVGTNAVRVIAQSNVNGAVNTDYTVPAGKTLAITQFFAGGETSGKESKFELWHSTDSGATNGTLLAFGYIGDGAQNVRADLNVSILGVGTTQVVRLRRERLDGDSRELAAAWEGNQTI